MRNATATNMASAMVPAHGEKQSNGLPPLLRGTDGSHLRQCKKGPGINLVHNALRDCLHEAGFEAGACTKRHREPHNILHLPAEHPQSGCRPGDVVFSHVLRREPGGGLAAEDIVSDVTVTRSIRKTATRIELERLSQMAGRAPAEAEKRKRNTHGMAALVAGTGKSFIPVALNQVGACSSGLIVLLKKLSESAAIISGWNPTIFFQRWQVRAAMVVIRMGANACLERISQLVSGGYRTRHRHLADPIVLDDIPPAPHTL